MLLFEKINAIYYMAPDVGRYFSLAKAKSTRFTEYAFPDVCICPYPPRVHHMRKEVLLCAKKEKAKNVCVQEKRV